MGQELEYALMHLEEAIYDEGPQPKYHRQVMKKHRKEWPVLWAAIDEVLEAMKYE